MTAPAARTGGRTSQGRGPAPGQHMPGRIQGGASSPGRTRAAAPASPAPRPAPQPRRPKPGPSAKTRQRQIGGQAARTARTAGVPGATDYQKVIAAEFVLAEVLVAATPFGSRKATGASPYEPRDMTKMLALGLTFFLLEVLAIPAGWGRLMAWFGGLVLLTVGLNEAANITKNMDLFAGINPKSSGGSSA